MLDRSGTLLQIKLLQLVQSPANFSTPLFLAFSISIISSPCNSISEELKSELEKIKSEHLESKNLLNEDSNNIDDDYVVSNELGEPIHPGYLSSLFGKFIKANNLPHVTLHGLRHTIASLGNSAGLTLYDISRILGHSSPDVTGKIYTHLFDETQRDAITKIQNKLKQ